jgi:xanthine dehydrogenase accessory factor
MGSQDLPQTDVPAQFHHRRDGLWLDENGRAVAAAGGGRDQGTVAACGQDRGNRRRRDGGLIDEEDERGTLRRDGAYAELKGGAQPSGRVVVHDRVDPRRCLGPDRHHRDDRVEAGLPRPPGDVVEQRFAGQLRHELRAAEPAPQAGGEDHGGHLRSIGHRSHTGPLMDEALAALRAWRGDGLDAALATVVRVDGSAPRGVGAKLAIADGGVVAGSVSGGCVEGDVLEHARAVLRTGAPELRRYGISDEQGLEVGLMCGGTIEVLIEPVRGPVARLVELFTALVAAQRPAAREIAVAEPIGTRRVLDGEDAIGVADSDAVVYDRALPPPRVWIVGAGHIAEHVAAFAGRAGFAPLVVDPRRLFAEQPRFEGVTVIPDWPDRAFAEHGLRADDAVVVLSHDPKIDEPALVAALGTESGPAYVGAIGSRRAQEDRRSRLLAAGLGLAQLDRLRAPIGLDLGGREPVEIGLAIVAELVAARHGRSGRPMSER